MRSEHGFSFPEVMVSMLILMGGLLMVAHSAAMVIESNYRSSQETLATTYAQDKIEYLKAVPFTHTDLTTGNHSDAPTPDFTRTWAVAVDSTGDRKTITLTVTRAIPDTALPVNVAVVLIVSR